MASQIMPAGLADPAIESQRIFRAVLNAFSRPGTVKELHLADAPPAPLMTGTAAVALTLFDLTTPVWVDPTLASDAAREYLGFHTGCTWAEGPAEANFAIIDGTAGIASFDDYAQGSLEYPDRSATVIVQVEGLAEGLAEGEGAKLTGPGIETEHRLQVKGVTAAFWAALADNHARFPLGIDLVLVARERIACLPRTTKTEV